MNHYYYRNHVNVRRDVNVLSVSGEGRLRVQPDMAIITIGIVNENKELKIAQSENGQTSANVIQAILNLGIPRENIQTVEFRIGNVFDFVEGRQIFRGYEVRHLLEVRLTDIVRVGEVVDTAIAAGANLIYNIRFETSERTAKYNEALSLAVKDAQIKANALAQSLGVQINPIPFKVNEAQRDIGPIPYQTFTTEKIAGATTQIEPGMLEIEAIIIAKFMYA